MYMLTRRTALVAAAAAGGVRPGSAHAATTLRVAYIPILAMAQLFVIEGEGWLKSDGIELQLTRFSSGPAMVQALVSGGYDVAYIGIGPAMVARGSGLPLKVVAATGINGGSLIGQGAFAQIFKAARLPAEAFGTFRRQEGRPARIATLPKGSVPEAVLQHWLKEVARVSDADVQVLGVGEDRVQQVLLSGAADAASILEPILTIVLERVPSAVILAEGGVLFPNQPGAVLAVSEQAIDRQRQAVQLLVNAHIRATALMIADPARAAHDTGALLGQGLIPEATLARAFTSQSMHPVADPHAIMDATQRLAAFQVSQGTLARAVPVAELFDTTFYDLAPK